MPGEHASETPAGSLKQTPPPAVQALPALSPRGPSQPSPRPGPGPSLPAPGLPPPRPHWQDQGRAALRLPRGDGDRDGTGGALGGQLSLRVGTEDRPADLAQSGCTGQDPPQASAKTDRALRSASVPGPLPRGVSLTLVQTQRSPLLRPTQRWQGWPSGRSCLSKGFSSHWGSKGDRPSPSKDTPHSVCRRGQRRWVTEPGWGTGGPSERAAEGPQVCRYLSARPPS